MTTIKWEGAGTPLPDGRRLIETHSDHNEQHAWVIVTDGRDPNDENAEVLWLDRDRCLDASTRHRPTIPVRDRDGESFTVPSDTPTILYLSKTLRWTIQDEVRGHYYNVR